DIESFKELEIAVAEKARETGEMFFRMDIKPTYLDTPENWEDKLEASFTSAQQR
ncbi:MAG: sulfur relay protein DsrC, partial [Thioalkalispiraceae bacterium]